MESGVSTMQTNRSIMANGIEVENKAKACLSTPTKMCILDIGSRVENMAMAPMCSMRPA